MRRRNFNSSFDLFLDTVCNTFGGILFIAILIAIQIRYVESTPSRESCSPERIAELTRRAEELTVEIDSASMVLKTIRRTLPEPIDENERKLVSAYSDALDKKNAAIARKAMLTGQCLAQVRENMLLERELERIEAKLEQLKVEESQRTRAIRNLRNAQEVLERKADDLRNLVGELKTEVALQTEKVREKSDPDENSRKEELHLPKMTDAGHLRPFYLVLRFNRLYVCIHREDFHYRGNQLGVPKKDRGFFVEDNDTVKRKIRNSFQTVAPSGNFIGVFVYGDSAESFHVVRDVIIASGFRYELIPTADDTPWSFGGGSGSTQVQ